MIVLEEKDYKNISKLMTDLMVRWKIGNTIVKEISMPDVMDIIGKCDNASDNEIVSKYWSQINEDEDNDISMHIKIVLTKHKNTVFMLEENHIVFDKEQLGSIISKYITSVPVIRI